MKIHFWSVGKPHDADYKNAIDDFTKRISKYYSIEWKIISAAKQNINSLITDVKNQESEKILYSLQKDDFVILLDERGKSFSSITLASFIEDKAMNRVKNLIFIIGGAFGVNDILLKRAQFVWKLSDLIFPHQIVRLILAEQVYRACTILNNEKYHHV